MDKDLHVNYYEAGDVLYIRMGERKQCSTQEPIPDLLLRSCYEKGEPSGVTILNFKMHKVSIAAREISNFLKVDYDMIFQKLSAIEGAGSLDSPKFVG